MNLAASLKSSGARAVRLPLSIGWRDHVVGASLAVTYLVWLVGTARALGFPRDEGVYFHAGAQYGAWWRSLIERGRDAAQQGAIDAAWGFNHEHPALMKSLFGLSEYYFHEHWHLFSDASTAFRLPAMALSAVALWTIYLFGARAWSRRAGLAAALLFALIPHVFFHAHLACFDMPITAMWILCVYVHWRAQGGGAARSSEGSVRTQAKSGGLGWALATGIVFGLALETKHNAWILPLVLVPHAFFVQRRTFWRELSVGRLPVPTSVLSMAVVGPLVFYALWPYLWFDTFARIEWWVEFHLNHEYYNIEYLGKNYFGPPSPKSYLPVMVLATVPSVTLVLFAVGAVDRAFAAVRRLGASIAGLPGLARFVGRPQTTKPDPVDVSGRSLAPLGRADLDVSVRSLAPLGRADRAETDLLLALAFLAPIGPFFLPATPIFGGTKHWLPAYPVLALLAGRGFDLVASALRSALETVPWGRGLPWRKWAMAQGALWACVLLAPLAQTIHSFPFGLSAYVPLVGGTAGGADLGLNRQFWGFTSQNAAEEYLNANAPRGSAVFIHDTTWDAWAHMQQEGRVRADLRASGAPSDSNIALVQHELHMNEIDYAIWVSYGTDAPDYIVRHDGVPIVSIYRR